MYLDNINLMRFQERNYKKTLKEIENQQREISTGNRINRAADDTAGLAISERLRASINAKEVGKRNIGDAKSLLGTMESGSQNIQDMLQRIRELAIQAQNDTYSSSDVASIQEEVNQILSEIDRTSNTTTFNGMNVLNNSDGLKYTGKLGEEVKIDIGNVWSSAPPSWTITTTFNVTNLDNTYYHSFGIGGSHNLTVFYTEDKKLSLKLNDGVFRSWIFHSDIQEGKDYEIQINFDNGDITTYINKEKTKTINGVGSIIQNDNNLIIGNSDEGNDRNEWNGEIRDFAIYSDSIEPEYLEENKDKLLGQWNFNESKGNIVKDKTGKNPDAIISGEGRWSNTGEKLTINTGNGESAFKKSNLLLESLGISNLDITDPTSINKIDEVIDIVSDQISKQGISMNRLDFSLDSVANIQINEKETLKRIKELDIANTFSKLTRDEIKLQSSSTLMKKYNDSLQEKLILLSS